MDYNDQPTSLVLDLEPQGKGTPNGGHELSNYDFPSQRTQSSLAILVDSSESQPPISPLSTPSPSIRIDDTMSDVSVLSPYTPCMVMSPTSDTPQQSPPHEYTSPAGLSPSASTLSLDPIGCAPHVLPVSHENQVAVSGYRAKAKGLQFKLPDILPVSEPGLLSPIDAIRQQEVYPLPSPMARDLRRRAEADDEDVGMDITMYEDDYGLGALGASNGSVEHKPTQAESSCLGLDLGLPASRMDENTHGLGSYGLLGRKAREENDAMGVNREQGVDEFRAQIMQATLAHSASAELVSSPEKSHDRYLDSTQTYRDGLKLPKTAPKVSLPLPKPCLKIALPLASPVKKSFTAYTLAPLPSTPPSMETANLKRDARKSNAYVGPSGRPLRSGPPSPSPMRKSVLRNPLADQSTIDLMQRRMHGFARFPTHFPKGYLLEVKFAQTYSLETELGAGGYGFVLGARHLVTDEVVAVKFMPRGSVRLVRDYKNDDIPLEAVVLQLARHPGVVQFRGLYEDNLYFYLVQELHGSPWSKNAKNQHKPGQESDSPESKVQAQHESTRSKPSSPVSHYAPTQSSPLRPFTPSMSMPVIPTLGSSPSQDGGPRQSLPLLTRPQMPRRASYDLFECIEQHERLSEGQAKYIFAQVVDTVKYLDSIGITHRDIKDENLVIDKAFKVTSVVFELRWSLTIEQVKVIDFGSAVIRDVRKPPPTYTRFLGTATFASPGA
ncbi:hypothetical protein FRC07_005003 [Ceratobasidium sp. 392]|nr:hypothetical protein FRC07_005003 [Ceratobasidium sp. 392]